MVVPSDKEYHQTKSIKQGKSYLDQDFVVLAESIRQDFGIIPLNIIYDRIDGKRPRLQVIFEYNKDYLQFRGLGTNPFDIERQKIVADHFKNIVVSKYSHLFSWMPDKYDYKNIWIVFSCFENIAKIEANESIPEKEIKNLQSQINDPALWTISRCFSSVTFLFYTDIQAKEYSNSELMKDKMRTMYFNVLKPYDEFGYITENNFPFHFDSKENFDKNSESNWYYYYK
jgi:hypothetical protein